MPDTEARLRAALEQIAADVRPAESGGVPLLKCGYCPSVWVNDGKAWEAHADGCPVGIARAALSTPAASDCHICAGQGCIQEIGKTCPECHGSGKTASPAPAATEAAIRADQRQKDVEIARNVAAEYERDNADTVDTIMHQMYAHMAAGARAAAAAVERAAERGEETK